MLITRKNRSPSKQILAKLMFQFPTRRHFKNCYINWLLSNFQTTALRSQLSQGVSTNKANPWKRLEGS